MSTSLEAEPILKELTLYNNPGARSNNLNINDFASLKNIERLTIRSSNLRAIGDPIIKLSNFTKLGLLDLSENYLANFSVADLPPTLTTIYLNGNRELKGFDQSFFTMLKESSVNYINVKSKLKLNIFDK